MESKQKRPIDTQDTFDELGAVPMNEMTGALPNGLTNERQAELFVDVFGLDKPIED